MRILLLAFPVLLSIACSAESLKPSSLAKNERITIDYDHGGDRSGYRRVYELTGDPTTMKVFEYYHWGYGENTQETPLRKKVVGELTIKKDDAIGLDRLLEFYRLKIAGDSTTKDHITVEHERDGKKIGKEEFVDQSGVATVAEMDGAREDTGFLKRNSRGVDVDLMKSLAPLYRFDKYLWKKEANQ